MSTEHDTEHDHTERDPMEERLRGAGARWRDAHETSARADFAAPARRGEPHGDIPNGGDSIEIALAPTAKPASRKGKLRWLVAGLTAAATVAAVLIAVAVTRPGGGGGSGNPAARSAAPSLLTQTWSLVEVRDSSNIAVPVSGKPTLRYDGHGFAGTDGCNHFSSRLRELGRGVFTLSALASTAMGCVGRPAGFDEMVGLIHAVLDGEVHYSVNGDTLTLTKPGVGTLVYRGAQPPPAVTDPKVLVATEWRLDTIVEGDNGSDGTASHSAGYAKVTLSFDNGRVRGNDGCNGFGGDVTIGQGTMSIGALLGTMMACPNSPDRPVRSVLTGDVTWSVTGDRLTIAKDGVGALTYVKAKDN